MAADAAMRARIWHALTFVVAAAALILQLVLVIQGHENMNEADIAEHGVPGLETRLMRFISYLTIWSNIMAAFTAAALVLNPDRDGRAWRALRLCTVPLLAVVAIVHWFFLRPLLDLHGADYLADKLLHVVVPFLVVVGWLVFGPHGRFQWADLPGSLVIPAIWLVYTLARGELVDWYPYPFIDVIEHGYGPVFGACAGVFALLLVLSAGGVWLDTRLRWGRRPVR